MAEGSLPLIGCYAPQRVFAWRDGQALNCERALADIQALAARLPPARDWLNLCEDRYLFTVAFAAVALAGGASLLPHSQAAGAVAGVRADQSAAGVLDDAVVGDWLATAAQVPPAAQALPCVPAAQKVAVVFTSGSTGRPRGHAKRWGDLVEGSRLYRQRLFPAGKAHHVAATVPPQHMYGLETSVLPVLLAGFAAHAARPFMPWAVAETLTALPAPRLLVTTPVHLRACLSAAVTMPPLTRVVSATAPLDAELAAAVEAAWDTSVWEVYGSTETGSVASRRPAVDDCWQLYDDMRLSGGAGDWQLHGSQLPVAYTVPDRLARSGPRGFRLLGRAADVLKVAGKRMSLAALTRQLLAIDGVDDAAAFLPDTGTGQRPAALVVAPALSTREIALRLGREVDAVFVPRPLLRVERLPRDRLGKLSRAALLAALAAAREHRA